MGGAPAARQGMNPAENRWSRRVMLADALTLAAWSALPAFARGGTARSGQDLAVHLLEQAEARVARAELTDAARLVKAFQAAYPGYATSQDLVRRHLRAVAVIQRDTGQGPRAERTYRELQAVAARGGNEQDYVEAIIGLVLVLANNGHSEQAERLFTAYQSRLNGAECGALRAEVAFWQSRLLLDRGDVAAARELMTSEVLPLSRAYEPPELRLARHVFMVRLALSGRRPDWRAAEDALANAHDEVDDNTPLLRSGQLWTAYALLHKASGEYAAALRYLDRAAATFGQGGVVSPGLNTIKATIERA
jgi:hypothetical protein